RPYQKNNYFFNPDDNLDYVASTGYAQLRAFQSNMYLFQYVHSNNFVGRVLAKCTGSNYPAINSSDLSKIKVEIPKPKEQQKIASCLSSLDELITAHKDKLDTLKAHKKGLMQNLFPKEGEKVPKYRFQEFEDDGEWVERSLEDTCNLVRGPFGGALKKEIFVKKGYVVYEQSHAIYGDFDFFRYYINDEKFSELIRFSIKPGDLIMSCSGTMGKFAIIPQDFEVGVINQALLKLTVKKGYDNLFVKMSLETDNNQNKLLSQSAGGAIKNVVSVSQIRKLSLFIPKLKEQQKIVSCLSVLDELITAQAEKIEQLQQHKKGLMQGLFPVKTQNIASQDIASQDITPKNTAPQNIATQPQQHEQKI
ncbi:MAG: hypothetical protein GXO88_03200, partial [Chlorobi bacterium]|nr:hypothetical protein [Chlorobiota bacterium]